MITAWNIFVQQASISVVRTNAMIDADDALLPYRADVDAEAVCRRCGNIVPMGEFKTSLCKGHRFVRYQCKDCRSLENRVAYVRRKK